MSLIRLQDVFKQFDGQVVLRDVTFELQPGQTVGLVGPNGAGKTTIFRLINGQIQPDTGTVTRSRGVQIGYLTQEPQVGLENTLHDEVASVFADLLGLERRLHALAEQIAATPEGPELHELMQQYDRVNAQFDAAGGYGFEQRLHEVLGGLGFSPGDYELPVRVLSGGQKCRAALAKLLLQDRQFLLLDEPTNHLDIDAVRWLEKFLAGHHGGAVVISHDRYLLDRLADRILELDARRVNSYPGNYSNFVQVRETRRLTQERQFEKDREFIEKERDFIARHMAGQRSKEARGRRTRLERRLESGEFVLEKPGARREMKLRIDAAQRQPALVLRVEELAKRYDQRRLFAGLNFELRAGQCLGITGPNGTGKSTLLKVILGQVAADAGKVELPRSVAVGYYAQESAALNPASTPLGELMDAQAGMREAEARSHLARFLFTGEDVFKPIGALSGGEQSRVRLMKLLLTRPSLLILDEPTNHLDIPAREALEDALLEFDGTILVVSHDRYFLDRVVDRLLVMRPEGHELHHGNYSSYIEQLEQAELPRQRPPETAPRTRAAGGSAPAGRKDAGTPKTPRGRFDKLSLDELEELIMQRETELAALNERFALPEVYKNAEQVAALRGEFDALKRELDAAQRAWNERVERGA